MKIKKINQFFQMNNHLKKKQLQNNFQINWLIQLKNKKLLRMKE
jgi:hypothetical protein